MHTPAQITSPQSICITSASSSFFSYCSYIPAITHSHAGHPMITANLIQLESSKAMLHLQDAKPI